MTDPIITYKNESVLAWLQEKAISGVHIDYVRPDDIAHRHVYGRLPYWLAAFADQVTELTVPRLHREDRDRYENGRMTVQEHDAAGAQLVTYQVRKVARA